MLRKLRERIQNEDGFTLIELLVVILIIGILAAIALPAFLGQQAKGQDSEAKSNARNLVSHVESCFAGTQAYDECQEPEETGLNVVSGTPAAAGEVAVTAAGAQGTNTYTVMAYSESGNTFSIIKGDDGVSTRECSDAGSESGGCDGSSW